MRKYTVNSRKPQFVAAFKSLPDYKELQHSMNNDVAVFEKARKIFYKVFPEVPRPKPIEMMDLVIDKQAAFEILTKRRKMVYGYYEEFMYDLYDQIVLDFEEEHWHDELWRLMLLDFNDSVRGTLNLHLHDDDDTWFLDVECVENNTVMLRADQLQDLNCRFAFRELDDKLAEEEAKGTPENKRPIYFYFALGKVLKTNL